MRCTGPLKQAVLQEQEEDHADLHPPSRRRKQPGAQLLRQPAEGPTAAAAGDVLPGWAVANQYIAFHVTTHKPLIWNTFAPESL